LNFLDTRLKEILKSSIDIDIKKNPLNHINIADVKFLAQWTDKREEDLLWKMFSLITIVDPESRQSLINNFYVSLDRKYNDQTIRPEMPRPEKVGIAVDKVVSNGISHIGKMMSGQTAAIFSWMIADQNTTQATYGDSQEDINELARVNVITGIGFIDPMSDGWNASAGFGRGTPSGTVAGTAMGSTGISATSEIFDRSVFPITDRITHVQNQDSFTLSALYVLTSI